MIPRDRDIFINRQLIAHFLGFYAYRRTTQPLIEQTSGRNHKSLTSEITICADNHK